MSPSKPRLPLLSPFPFVDRSSIPARQPSHSFAHLSAHPPCLTHPPLVAMASIRAVMLPSAFTSSSHSMLARLPTLPLAAARLAPAVVRAAHRTNAAATDEAPVESEPIMDNALFCYQVDSPALQLTTARPALDGHVFPQLLAGTRLPPFLGAPYYCISWQLCLSWDPDIAILAFNGLMSLLGKQAA